MATLRQIIPISTPTWGVFATAGGEPEFRAVACLGAMVDENKQLIAGFCVGEHIEPADLKPDFVGFATSTDPAPWRERCLRRREALDRKAAAANGQEIVIPDVIAKPGEWNQ